MLKNLLNYGFRNTIAEQKQIVKLHQMNRVVEKETKVSVVSEIISFVLIVASFFIRFPQNINGWVTKGGEIIAIIAAVYLLTLAVTFGIKKRRTSRDKILCDIEARKKNLSIERYMARYIGILVNLIIVWAKFHKIKVKYTRHNHLRNVIDFYNFPIDYIDINVINYRLFFTIRINDLELMSKISDDLPRSCKNLVLIVDKYHIGPKEPLSLNEEGIISAKEMIINIILSKVYNIVYF